MVDEGRRCAAQRVAGLARRDRTQLIGQCRDCDDLDDEVGMR
jgi:hypothetical protein